MFRYSVLLVALAVNGPEVWAALYTQTVPLESAAVRFLVTVPVVAVLLGLVRAAMQPPASARRPGTRDQVGYETPER